MPWFTDNPEAERLAGIIFDLRRDLFRYERFSRAQEGVWETVEEEERRARRNEERLREWDNETRGIILALTPQPRSDDNPP